jgi:hypothetical protein
MTRRTEVVLAVAIWIGVPVVTIAVYAWLYGRAG